MDMSKIKEASKEIVKLINKTSTDYDAVEVVEEYLNDLINPATNIPENLTEENLNDFDQTIEHLIP